MCLIIWAYECHPDYPLILVANRDEQHARATQPAHFWPDQPELLAGRDLEQGGTWLGIRKDGRWAAVTNFRDLEYRRYPLSRGNLTREFLSGNTPTDDFIQRLRPAMPQYAGFNLLLGDGRSLYYCSNRTSQAQHLQPGIYGLSNHLLNTPWPKLERAKAELSALLAGPTQPTPQALAELLAVRDTYPPNPRVPQTQTALDPVMERQLSAAFITTPVFGTRCTTVLMLSREGHIYFEERSFDSSGQLTGTETHRLAAPA